MNKSRIFTVKDESISVDLSQIVCLQESRADANIIIIRFTFGATAGVDNDTANEVRTAWEEYHKPGLPAPYDGSFKCLPDEVERLCATCAHTGVKTNEGECKDCFSNVEKPNWRPRDNSASNAVPLTEATKTTGQPPA
jgi:hypothetical protein